MTSITEFFVVRLLDEEAAAHARDSARPVFCALEGVQDWRTYRSVAKDRPTLFVEAYTFDSAETAKAAGAQFSELAETKAFLGQIEEMLVGQHFVDITKEKS